MTAYYGLTNRNPFNPPTRRVGLRNYTEPLGDAEFLKALANTVVVTVIVMVPANVGGLLIAQLLDRPTRLHVAPRRVFFTPVVLSSVVVSVIRQVVLTDDGLLDSALRGLGVEDPPGRLSDPGIAGGPSGAEPDRQAQEPDQRQAGRQPARPRPPTTGSRRAGRSRRSTT